MVLAFLKLDVKLLIYDMARVKSNRLKLTFFFVMYTIQRPLCVWN